MTVSGSGAWYVIEFFRQKKKRLKEEFEKYLKLKRNVKKLARTDHYYKPKK